MSEKTWMPLFIGDYLADTQRLTAEQHGAYLLLIMDYWRNGSLPNNDDVLDLITKGAWAKHKAVLLTFFMQDGDALRHLRIEKEIAKAAEKHHRAKEKASAAANKRWGNNATSTATRNACSMNQAMHEQCPSPSPSPSPSPKVSTPLPPAETDAAMLLLDRLNEILGIDPAKQINPNWHKTQIQLCREWIALGRQPDQITAIVSAVAERQRGADPAWRASTLRYFDAAVRRGEAPKPPDPLKGWRPKTYTEEELGWYRDAAVIAAARQIPDKLWREPRGRDWTLRLESFSKSKSKRWPDAWGDPPWEVGDNPLAAELLQHFTDARPA